MNSIVGLPELSHSSEINMNGNTQLSAEQKKSQALVFGILDQSLSKREKMIFYKRFLERYNDYEVLDKIITNLSIGHIMEMVISSYLIENNLGIQSTLKQDKYNSIDFILKYENIKIGVDFTSIGNEKDILKYKLQRLNRQAYYLDHTDERNSNEAPPSISRDVDIVGCINFFIPSGIRQEIASSFIQWKKENYHGFWKDYIKNLPNIEYFFQTLTNTIQELTLISHIPSGRSLEHIGKFWDYTHEFDKQDSKLKISLYKKGNSSNTPFKNHILDFYLLYTQKYCDKIGLNANITRDTPSMFLSNPRNSPPQYQEKGKIPGVSGEKIDRMKKFNPKTIHDETFHTSGIFARHRRHDKKELIANTDKFLLHIEIPSNLTSHQISKLIK